MPSGLPLAERVCLALVTQKVSHGWALGTMLAPDGELGRIWTLSAAADLSGRSTASSTRARHPHRPGRRAGPRPGHCSPRPRPADARRQAVARRAGRAPARRPHRAARQAAPARPGRPRQRAAARRPAGARSRRPSTSLTSTQRGRRPRRPVAPGERPRRPPVPRPGPAPADAGRPRQARAAHQRPQPAARHRHRRPPRRGDVDRQGRARRRTGADRGDHQGRRRPTSTSPPATPSSSSSSRPR